MDLTTPESWSGPFHLRGSGLVDILLHLPSRQGSLSNPNRHSHSLLLQVCFLFNLFSISFMGSWKTPRAGRAHECGSWYFHGHHNILCKVRRWSSPILGDITDDAKCLICGVAPSNHGLRISKSPLRSDLTCPCYSSSFNDCL